MSKRVEPASSVLFFLCSDLSDGEAAGGEGETEECRNNTKVAQWRRTYQAAAAKEREGERGRDRNRKVSGVTKDGWSETEERAELRGRD